MKHILYYTALLGVLLSTGCSTDVELCHIPHPHRTLLDFRFVWDAESEQPRPDSMHVVAIRLFNSLRYDYRITSNESGNTGELLYPSEEQTRDTLYDEEGNIQSIIPDKIWARSGDYQFVTFSSHVSLQVDENSDQQEYIDPLKDLTFTYKPVPLAQCMEKLGLSDWRDYNPYAGYILNEGAQIYYDNIDYQTLPTKDPSDTTGVVVTFTPHLITPQIHFEFDIEKEKEVVIDSIWGEISGIPKEFDFSNKTLNLAETYKMLFRFDYPAMPTHSDSASATHLKNMGQINVTSIVPSYARKLTTGPGILHLSVYTHSISEDNRKRIKIFRVCINLFETLNNSGLLVWNAQKNAYEQGDIEKEYNLRIETPLKVSRDRILNNEDDTILDNWKELGRIDIDI